MRASTCLFFLLGSSLLAQSPELESADGQHKRLGNLNTNQFDPDSVANPFGRYGSPFSPDSVNNRFGPYGSPYSPYSANNPYATQAPKIVTPSGAYLGQLSANPYAPQSTSNPYGGYGSPYSGKSINNPYGPYGSPYSPESATNPYGVGAYGAGQNPTWTPLPSTLPSAPATSWQSPSQEMPSYSIPVMPRWSAPTIRPALTTPLPALPALPALPTLPSLPTIPEL